jgi:hypothetical protein
MGMKKWHMVLILFILLLLLFVFMKPPKRELMAVSSGDERVDNLMKLFSDAGVDLDTKFNSSDRGSENVYNFSYNKPHLENTCGPDWTFVSWPSACIDSFEDVTNQIERAGRSEPVLDKVGWHGNLYSASHDVPEGHTRPLLKKISDEYPDLLDVTHVSGNEIKSKGTSLPDLVSTYKYLLDIGGNGYSGRLSYLLFSNRPLLFVERDHVQYYVKDLEPYVHYVPVKRDLSNLIEQIQWMQANEEKCKEIAKNAQDFAKTNFTHEKILERVRYAAGNVRNKVETLDKGTPLDNLVIIRAVDPNDPRVNDIRNKTKCESHVILDVTNRDSPDTFSGIQHSEDSCRAANPLHKDIRYSLDSVLWHVYERFKDVDFKYLWLLEDDVYCDGSLDQVIHKNESNTKDFLASFVEDYGSNVNELNWMWWDSVEGQGTEIPSLENRVKSFFPVTRYSKEFLKEIHDSIGVYSGYCEVYIPTLAKQKGYTYGNLSEDSIGNLSLVPIHPMPTNNDGKLYHKWALNM